MPVQLCAGTLGRVLHGPVKQGQGMVTVEVVLVAVVAVAVHRFRLARDGHFDLFFQYVGKHLWGRKRRKAEKQGRKRSKEEKQGREARKRSKEEKKRREERKTRKEEKKGREERKRRKEEDEILHQVHSVLGYVVSRGRTMSKKSFDTPIPRMLFLN